MNIADARAIVAGTHPDPFSVLGPHKSGKQICLRAFLPWVDTVEVVDPATDSLLFTLNAVESADGLFEGIWPGITSTVGISPSTYKYKLSKVSTANTNHEWYSYDPFCFSPVLGELDEHLIAEGSHLSLWKVLGAHLICHDGIDGVHFATWAPNASRVSVIGDFNHWDGRCHCMRRRGQTGVWETFIPGLVEGETYKYELLDSSGNLLPKKSDPFGFGSEHPPKTASVIRDLSNYTWSDSAWLSKRQALQAVDKPVLIYEVHAGSWKKIVNNKTRALSYQELAVELVTYVKDMGFTHIEFMPVSEFPFDGSWGYQPVGLFAPTIRHGTLNEFRAMIDACHQADIGVILDWVPGHFPEDQHGLGRFDGTALYEHADHREGFHPDWKTLVYNYGRLEVANFLLSNALYWFEEHHIDGLRVDAVASMLYRDYSRKDGEWIPNEHGGRENLEAIDFLRRVNEVSYAQHPDITTIAEESTAFPGVSNMTSQGGLGFGYKWNMGWMNDTLSYMEEDPINRKHHHHKMTFGLHYAFSENFVLPLSHDEVVHGKGSLIDKMPGSHEEKFANLRAYYGFMWGHPGKKLLFMGGEFAQYDEWNHNQSLDWHLLDDKLHKGMQNLIRDLNNLVRVTPALHQLDNDPAGFGWIKENAADESVFAWCRYGQKDTATVLVVCNFTPVQRTGYRVGVATTGNWIEKLNTDATHYGGQGHDVQGRGNCGLVKSEPIESDGHQQSLCLTLPPLSTLIFEVA